MKPKTTESKMKPGEFKFVPFGDWICIEKINIESKMDKAAKRLKLGIVGGATPKNIMDIEKKKANEYLTYEDYAKDALDIFEGKHGHQGVVKAVGPHVLENFGVKPGQKVLLRGSTGEPMVHNKRLYWLFKPHEVYGSAPKNEHDI